MRRAILALAVLVPLCASARPFALKPGRSLQLMAMTAGPAVTWSVEEAGGGTVDGTGFYTAPACAAFSWPQTFHIDAVSGALKTVVTVVVNAVQTTVLVVTPSNVNLKPGGTQQFTASTIVTCQ